VHTRLQNDWVGIGWGQEQGKSGFSTTRCGIIEVSIEQSVDIAKPCNRMAFSFWGHLSPHLSRSITMQLVNQYKSFVIANISWADALAQALGKKEFLPDAVVEKLAHAHAEAYGEKHKITIHYQQTSTGSWQFYSHEDCERENRHDTATKQWQRSVGKYHKTKSPQRIAKQADPVDRVVKSLRNKFSRTELKRIAKALAE
jgi:hypothetical protein